MHETQKSFGIIYDESITSIILIISRLVTAFLTITELSTSRLADYRLAKLVIKRIIWENQSALKRIRIKKSNSTLINGWKRNERKKWA